MSDIPRERLYQLLPALYRRRDVEHGEPLRALLAIMERELRAVEADIEGLYENWFIETCDDWVIPYIADLLGVRGLGDSDMAALGQRARVANTLRYRRRQGTRRALEDLIQDATGWTARTVELYEHLGTTQHVRYPRPGKGALADLRAIPDAAVLDGPFDPCARLVDVRAAADGSGPSTGAVRGRPGVANLAVFLWRLESHGVTGSPAAACDPSFPGRYTFDPLGRDTALFTRPDIGRGDAVSASAVAPGHAEALVPGPIRCGALRADLDQYCAAHVDTVSDQRPLATSFYGSGRSLAIYRDRVLIPPIEIVSADLTDWPEPAAGTVAVDTRLGRIAFPAAHAPVRTVHVDYHYGFSASIGGGPYDRSATIAGSETEPWRITVRSGAAVGSTTIQEALTAWAEAGRPRGVIRIADSGLYTGPLAIVLGPGGRLVIEAADGVRPSLHPDGPIRVRTSGTGSRSGATDSAALVLNGLRINGTVRVAGELELSIVHCTLTRSDAGSPDQDVLVTSGNAGRAAVIIDSSVVGPLALDDACRSVTVRDSIVGARPEPDLIAPALRAAGPRPGPLTTVERTTVLGGLLAWEIEHVSESIVTGPVQAERLQVGCVRYSYIVPGSRTPGRFRCQPDLALDERLRELAGEAGARGLPAPATLPPDERARVLARLEPRFTSGRPDHPGLGQLAQSSAIELRAGAEDGSEMGAFCTLAQPRRETSLHQVVREHAPAGLDIGIFYIT
jgi:hypothetical protein